MKRRNGRPPIAITPDFRQAAPPSYLLKEAYVEAVSEAGGEPWILPFAESAAAIQSALGAVAGIVVTGGAFDIAPERYGQRPRAKLGPTDQRRTEFEWNLLRSALRRRIPVLGICGGMQLLNVVLGGTLYQDIAQEIPGSIEHEQKGPSAKPSHSVLILKGTTLASWVRKGQLDVNSTHHQALDRLGRGLLASAWASDGVIEAIEKRDGSAFGIQWHPEAIRDSVPKNRKIYEGFIATAMRWRIASSLGIAAAS